MITAHHLMADKLRKAARNGTRLTLDVAQVQLLMSPRIYQAIALLEMEELTAPCRQENEPKEPRSATNLEPTGSGIARTAALGQSVGWKVEQRAADALVSRAARQLSRPKKLRTH
jgi:hypothetical protein